MIARVEARTRQGQLLTFPLDDISGGFIVKEIEGLDPVKATLVSTSFANMDGEQYHNSRRDSRNIKLKLELDTGHPVDSVRDLRNRLYSFFMPKTQVTLRFVQNDGLEVDIAGRIEDFECPLFVQEPVADISIMCFDPDFYDATEVLYSGQSNAGTTKVPLAYSGTVETGIDFRLFVDRALPEFTIYHTPPDGTLRTLDFSAPLMAGDELYIRTVVGEKSVTLNRGGAISSVLYGMSPSSSWIEFAPGVNQFQVYAEGAAIPYTIEYTTKYGGL